MIDLQHLLTQLGSETRLSILGILRHREMDVQQISDELYVSSTEVMHGIDLLIEAGMVGPTDSGLFQDTGYGSLIWENLIPLKFTATNQNYLRAHDLRLIPIPLLRNIDRLSSASIISARSEAFDVVKGYWKNVVGEFSIITESLTPDLESMMARMVISGIKVRCLFPQEVPVEHLIQMCGRERHNQEVRIQPQCKMLLHVSRNFALMALKKNHGGSDAEHIIVGTDENTISWCRDLFAYHWSKSNRY
jgi:predicted transcriptional regulator